MEKALFWHRRDLRIHDNSGLFKALSSGYKIQPVFIFDTTILDKLPPNDKRILFIHNELLHIKKQYQKFNSDLLVLVGNPTEVIPHLIEKGQFSAVYTNRDYEPYAKQRDSHIFNQLAKVNKHFIGSKDHVIFEKEEVMKDDGSPYTVFTPYAKKWKSKLSAEAFEYAPSENHLDNLLTCESQPLVSLEELGFSETNEGIFPQKEITLDLIKNYAHLRDIPSENGTSRLSVHLRFGTISIRELAKKAIHTSDTYLNELIWRDFYQMIIYHFPTSVYSSFKPKYDLIEWENNENHFHAWCEGKTGYPLVDAGMRELNETGFMHNRVRMVVASFLTKHLLIDWRWGEAYFAEKLLDFELASNVGGWQWAASSGCDAAPYFRVFNPYSQQEKFDKSLKYIKKWVPEYGTDDYPEPIVEHTFARNRVLDRYKKALTT